MPDCNEDFKLQAPLAWLDSGAQNPLRTKRKNRQIRFRPRTNRYSPRADTRMQMPTLLRIRLGGITMQNSDFPEPAFSCVCGGQMSDLRLPSVPVGVQGGRQVSLKILGILYRPVKH